MPMNSAAVSKSAAHRVHDAGVAAEQIGDREERRQQEDAAPEARRGRSSRRRPAEQVIAARGAPERRRSRSRRRPLLADADAQLGARSAGRRPCAIRISSGRSARRARAAPLRDAAHDPPRQHADDLADDDRRAVVIDPDFVQLVSFARSSIGRQEAPGRYSTFVTRPATGVRLMCTSSGDRKIVTCFQSPGGRPSRVGRARRSSRGRRPARRPVRHPAGTSRSGIAKEVGEERAEQRRKRRRSRVAPLTASRGAGQRAGDERISGPIDFHRSAKACEMQGPETVRPLAADARRRWP